jgi:uncharacterized protein with GYD domain
MPTFVALIDWTDQGVRGFKESVDRYEASREQFERLGVTFKDIFWTLGTHDIVAIVDAPDGESFAAALLSLAGAGNVRTTTLRGFTPDEMRGIIEKAG